MPKRATADLPLHSGAAPAWLFRRMVDLAGAMGTLIVRDQGPEELLRRLSDPFWFQAFGCVLGFDWHSSGVTTTVCGALKEVARKCGGDLGLVVCGGKGATSRKTPHDIRRACERSGDDAEYLVRASRLSAKVDSAAVQDGYQLYHHCFFFVPGRSAWCVVQQGMNDKVRYARRYHWLSETMPSYVSEPHAAVACDHKSPALNLVAGEGEPHRQAVAALSREKPDRILWEIRSLIQDPPLPLFDTSPSASGSSGPRRQPELGGASRIGDDRPTLSLPARHSLSARDLNPAVLRKVLVKTYEQQAPAFEQLLGAYGIGPQALRSLSLIAELVYHAPASRRDPAAYSFAHGGKDGHPYHVNKSLYDANIHQLRETINRARIGITDKTEALKTLAAFVRRLESANSPDGLMPPMG